ncbi:esterase/lipase family protein [Marinivivus vitaminiproducens]|uniref:esterase/lipase family protein n=1 Tax=Marinivivus vitaminiproducens TaxID=3035935 RepID=UPI00279F7252|nr:alpha/beta fold hydrolase [Geminicoccaceae bacterium SCSIO 64248]
MGLRTIIDRSARSDIPAHTADHPAATLGTVVLLHGLGRTPASMKVLETTLRADGYAIENWSYASRKERLPALVDRIAARLEPLALSGRPLHLVGHSLGGLLLRGAAARLPGGSTPGRLVMIGSPNRGVRLLARLGAGWLSAIFGQPVRDLVWDSPALLALGTPAWQVGIIAGTRQFPPVSAAAVLNAILYRGVSGDGTVEVESARWAGMADFVMVHVGHTTMCQNRDVVAHVRHFLGQGRFDTSPAESGVAIRQTA